MTDLSFLNDKPFAHRGLHIPGRIPENSIQAVSLALEKGYSIEIDVRRTADDKIILFHDRRLERLTGLRGEVKNFTYEELKNLNLSSSSEKIPLLEEALEEINGKEPLLIEIKAEKGNRAVEENIWKIIKDYKGPLAVMSFNPYSMKWFRSNAPQVARGQLISCVKFASTGRRTSTLLYANICSTASAQHFTAYNIECLPNKAMEMDKKKKRLILTWTVKSKLQQARAMLHADNIIFENILP